MSSIKIKVHVDGRCVGWLRQAKVDGNGHEVFTVMRDTKATEFDDQISMAAAMIDFVGPERATARAREPVVSFQLVHI